MSKNLLLNIYKLLECCQIGGGLKGKRRMRKEEERKLETHKQRMLEEVVT
jgi:hypothetical protein